MRQRTTPDAIEWNEALSVNVVLGFFVLGVVLGLGELIKFIDYFLIRRVTVATSSLAMQREEEEEKEKEAAGKKYQKSKLKLSSNLAAPESPSREEDEKMTKKLLHRKKPGFTSILSKFFLPKIGKEEEEEETLLSEQETRLLHLTNIKCLNLIGTLLDEVFDREYGSSIVRGMPTGLKHQCWSMEFMKRVSEAESRYTLKAASNPMQAKKRGTDIVTYMGDRTISSPRSVPQYTPRGTKLQLASDGIHEGVKDTNYPHRLHYQPPDLNERTRYWYYYQCLQNPSGKYWTLLVNAPMTPLPALSSSASFPSPRSAETRIASSPSSTSSSNSSGSRSSSLGMGSARQQHHHHHHHHRGTHQHTARLDYLTTHLQHRSTIQHAAVPHYMQPISCCPLAEETEGAGSSTARIG